MLRETKNLTPRRGKKTTVLFPSKLPLFNDHEDSSSSPFLQSPSIALLAPPLSPQQSGGGGGVFRRSLIKQQPGPSTPCASTLKNINLTLSSSPRAANTTPLTLPPLCDRNQERSELDDSFIFSDLVLSPCSRRRHHHQTSPDSSSRKSHNQPPGTSESKSKQHSGGIALPHLPISPARHSASPRRVKRVSPPLRKLQFSLSNPKTQHQPQQLQQALANSLSSMLNGSPLVLSPPTPPLPPPSANSSFSASSPSSSSSPQKTQRYHPRVTKGIRAVCFLVLVTYAVMILQSLWETQIVRQSRTESVRQVDGQHAKDHLGASNFTKETASTRRKRQHGEAVLERHQQGSMVFLDDADADSKADAKKSAYFVQWNDGTKTEVKTQGTAKNGGDAAADDADDDARDGNAKRIILLWGILSHHGLRSAERRQAIRETYLSFGANATRRGGGGTFSYDSPPKVCRLSELSTAAQGCDMAYAFVLGRHPNDAEQNGSDHSDSALDPSSSSIAFYGEDDALYLDVPDGSKNVENIRKTLAWIRYASGVAKGSDDRTTMLIGVADTNTLVYTPHLLRHVHHQGTIPHDGTDDSRDVYVTSPTVHSIGSSANSWYYMSPDVAAAISDEGSCDRESAFAHRPPRSPAIAVTYLIGTCFQKSSGGPLGPDKATWQALAAPAGTTQRLRFDWKNLVRLGRADDEDDEVSKTLPTDRYIYKMAELLRRNNLVRIPPPSKPWSTFQAYYDEGTKKVIADRSHPTSTNATVTYVSGKFSRTREFVHEVQATKKAVLESGLFPKSQLHFYTELPDFVRSDPRWTRHTEFLRDASSPSTRGAGYWFWKAPLIHHHLSKMDHGDWLAYADADLIDHVEFLPTLLAELDDRDANLALYEQPFEEREWTKRDAYDRYCPGKDQSRDTSHQYAGGWVIVRKTERTVQLMTDWVDAVSDYHMVSDEPSVLPNQRYYREHRHDQSLLNLLMKCVYKEPNKRRYLLDAVQSVFTINSFRL